MLGIGAWLPPNQISSLIVNRISFAINALPIALHNALLQVGRQTVEVLGVRNNHLAFCSVKVIVPQGDQRKYDRNVFIQRRICKMCVHGMSPFEEFLEMIGANPQCNR